MYSDRHIEVKHEGLNRYRIVTGISKSDAQAKANALAREWDKQWDRKLALSRERQERAARQKERERARIEHEENVSKANRLTAEAEQMQLELGSILLHTLGMTPVDWDNFRDGSAFMEEAPIRPIATGLLPLPERDDAKYNPKMSMFQKLSKTKRFAVTSSSDQVFRSDYRNIQQKNEAILESNATRNKEHHNALNEWDFRRNEFYRYQSAHNTAIEMHKNGYKVGNADAIGAFHANMLSFIKDPFDFERQVEAFYQPESKLLLLDLNLPTIENLSNLKKVTYIKASGEFRESFQTESYMNKIYEDVIYQIVLQTFYLVFLHDEQSNYIDSIVLNGRVITVDKTTGSFIEPYILSVSVKKSDFQQLNLSLIDPKAWFKSSKGISAAKIAMVTPVAPIATIDKEDSRFVDGYSVMSEMDNSINLASMDWQDFENLIRDLFGEEFNINGGEVKITQASRDGGVDAVAFDPSPIRGGKIVIQAKRYTNVVGVSAVRDLYGTVLNEGAMKGILITTSNYGNDAYKFAQGKPLTLLNGANLLAMLEKHGHKARIDLKEAKELQKLEMSNNR